MNHSVKTGFSFGLTSGIITTLGLMVGIESATSSKVAVTGAILTIAIADAMSDALGIHMSEESTHDHTPKEVWQSTISTLLFKFCFAAIFLIPVLLLELTLAVWVSVATGILILGVFSFEIARRQRAKIGLVVAGHLVIVILVIFAAKFVGSFVSKFIPS